MKKITLERSFVNLRITPQMKELLERAALHCGLDVSDLIRRCGRRFISGRKAISKDLSEYTAGNRTELLPVRNFALPENVSVAMFLEYTTSTCLHICATTAGIQQKEFHEVCGVDYILEKENEE